jgi:hypothetical protein
MLFHRITDEESLKTIVACLAPTLQIAGFSPAGPHAWERQSRWKVEEIDLGVETGVRTRILPSFRVMLPRKQISPLGDTYEYVAQVNIARYLRPAFGPEFAMELPKTPRRLHEFSKKVVRDVQNALPWFEQFATPELFVSNLSKFLKQNCPAYVDAKAYLESLKG